MGGSYGMIGRDVQGLPQGNASPYGAQTTPVASNQYSSKLSSNQALNAYSQPSALNQQMMQPSPYLGGLQNLYSMFNAPRQYAPMPQYQNRALAYRPNMASAQQALSRTATTQAEAQAAAEAAARAKLEAEMGISGEDADFLRWQRQQYEASRNSFNSGG